jgi:hypothetical protein
MGRHTSKGEKVSPTYKPNQAPSTEPASSETKTSVPGRNKVPLVVLAVAALFLISVSAFVYQHRAAPAKEPVAKTPSSPAASASPQVLVPADGELVVMGVKVPQMLGVCSTVESPEASSPSPSSSTLTPKSTGSCRFVSAGGKVAIVKSGAKNEISLSSGISKTFSVSVRDVKNPSSTIFAPVIAGNLVLKDVPSGSFQVSVLGSQGGTWQFELERKVAAKPSSQPAKK